MTERTSFLSPKIEVRALPEKDGFALFACAPISRDEVLMAWGGRVVTYDELITLSREQRGHAIQIDEGLYQSPIRMDEPADYVNHSCNPNGGLRGQIVLVAMRDIAVDEEVTFDYAMADSTPYDEFECACNAPGCRGRVSADDWKRPELWERYAGYFSPYLQRRIASLKKGQRIRTA